MKRKRVSPEIIAKQMAGRNKIQFGLQKALEDTLSKDWMRREDIHRKVNLFMREFTDDKLYDCEFIQLNEAINRFSKGRALQYRVEREGKYQSQKAYYVKIGRAK